MKISTSVLRRFVEVPDDGRTLRNLFDDIGVEVKRHDIERGLFTLELLANRGDHHCYIGLAREISGRTGTATGRPECVRRASDATTAVPSNASGTQGPRRL